MPAMMVVGNVILGREPPLGKGAIPLRGGCCHGVGEIERSHDIPSLPSAHPMACPLARAGQLRLAGLSGEALLQPVISSLARSGSTAEARRFRGHIRVGLTAGAKSATIVAMTTEALRTVRDHFSDVVDRVESQHERVMVTRNGKPAAVIISPDDLAELEERLEILSDPDAMAEIREGRDAYERGDVISGVDAVRALRK